MANDFKVAVAKDAFDTICNSVDEIVAVGSRFDGDVRSAFDDVVSGVRRLNVGGPEVIL